MRYVFVPIASLNANSRTERKEEQRTEERRKESEGAILYSFANRIKTKLLFLSPASQIDDTRKRYLNLETYPVRETILPECLRRSSFKFPPHPPSPRAFGFEIELREKSLHHIGARIRAVRRHFRLFDSPRSRYVRQVYTDVFGAAECLARESAIFRVAMAIFHPACR